MDAIRIIIAAGLALSLVACASMGGDASFAGDQAKPPQREYVDAPDPCGANALKHLEGQLVSEIHEPSLPQPYRIIGPKDPVTMDSRPNRLNINHNEDGIIVSLRCG